jgi:glycosyltransferase involved in cell wall biosynthesis
METARRHPALGSSAATMRVLQVLEPPEGGVQRHVRALVEGLVERGHRVDVVGPRDPALLRPLAEAGAGVRCTELVPELAATRANLRALRDLVAVLRGNRYDLVHLHAAKAGALGRPAAAVGNTPALYTPHSFVYWTQHHRGRRGAELRRWLTLGIERALAPLTRTFVCISEDERQAAIDDRIAPPERIVVARYGIPEPPEVEPDPRLASFRGAGPLFGLIARLSVQKGLPVLLDALERLRDAGSLPRFAIVGNGPERDAVARRISESALEDRVLLLPFEEPGWPYLAALDAFVLPSLWEGLPLAVLEAMAAGLPVIASEVNGIPEAVSDGETGLLVPRGEAIPLASAITRLAADGSERTRMGEAGRRRYDEEFTSAAMVERTEAAYRRALAA